MRGALAQRRRRPARFDRRELVRTFYIYQNRVRHHWSPGRSPAGAFAIPLAHGPSPAKQRGYTVAGAQRPPPRFDRLH
ncbi:MAG: hypothetical protein ACI8PT_002267 [Gammaproteobacteria bacterium]|jgi:hypothetical protein